MSFARMFGRVACLSLIAVGACGGAKSNAPPAHTTPVASASPAPSAPVPAWSDAESPIPVSSRDPMWGHREAPVTLVVFSDFQCPFCARFEDTLTELRTTYGPDKLRIIWKNQPLPFHANAKLAAVAAQTVFELGGADAFWKFHDLAFANQRELLPDQFAAWAARAGVSAEAFRAHFPSNAAVAKVTEDQALADKVGANGTPTSFVNGIVMVGAQPVERFKQVVDLELANAHAKTVAGTAKDKVYVALSTENFKAPSADRVEEEEEPVDTTVWKVPVGNSPVRGKSDAPVTIIEFSDFQCPFCKRVEPTLDEVRKTYGDKVRIVWKDEPLPFHKDAVPAAELARYAYSKKGNAGFWDIHDRLFASQPALGTESLASIARAAGLDPKAALTSVDARAFKKGIEADASLADDIGAHGTPHFFINGRRLVGAQPLEKFKSLIDDELKKFDDQRSKVSGKDYYETLMKTAQGAPEPEKKQAPKVDASMPFRGKKDAKVVIQEWSDFQCPFCSRVEPTLAKILKDYGDKVKLVWHDKPLPFHTHAALAAEAAREAFAQKGNAGFWKLHDTLFANQADLSEDALLRYAKEAGLDVAKFKAALDAGSHKPEVVATDMLGTELGISGTPAFLINDYVLSGAQPYENFKKLIDRALSEAK